MKTWKGYNLIDLILLISGIVAVTVSGILFGSKWYILVNTIMGLLCVFTQAKGKVLTQFFGVIHFIFYIYVSYTQNFYGEALLYLLMLPMYIYGIIHWLANRDKKDNVVIVREHLSKKEWIIFSVSLVIVSVGIYFLLKVLNTSLLIISTLSFVSMLPGLYLLMRRSKWNQVAFLINDLIVPVLWIFLVAQGDFSFLPMCIYHFFQMAYDVYGLFEWIKLEKKQKESIKN